MNPSVTLNKPQAAPVGLPVAALFAGAAARLLLLAVEGAAAGEALGDSVALAAAA